VSTHRIRVAWHQLYLAPFDTSPQFVGAGAGTLVAVAEVPGHLIVRTGCATGPVRATLTVHSASPEVALDGGPGGTGPWEAVEEVSMPVTEPLFWFSPDPGLDLPTEAAFAPATPGPHRFRISARGRNLAYDLAILEPVEDYLIQVWPEPDLRAPSVILSDR
jgi:hypothetical protein